jgi:hypothetical protein
MRKETLQCLYRDSKQTVYQYRPAVIKEDMTALRIDAVTILK